MRPLFSILVAILVLISFRGQAQQKGKQPAKTMAILPTLTNISKATLRPGIDSASYAQIQESEALREQSKNFYLIAQKSPNYNVVFQPFSQTNFLLQQAGITYGNLGLINQQELAAILGVDLLFFGINYRNADSYTPEERLATNLAISMLLPPLMGSVVKAKDQPVTTMHYLLYDNLLNNAIWHYKDETTRPRNEYLDNFRKFLATRFPKQR